MPKRPNPFGDASPLQFKSHIGTKEVNHGVCGEQKMHSVFEKTKSLLFEGSKKAPTAPTNPFPSPPTSPEQLKLLPGQLLLDSAAHLCPLQEASTQPSSVTQMEMDSPFGMTNNNNDAFSFMTHASKTSVPSPLPGQMQITSSGQLMAPTRSTRKGVSWNPLLCSSCHRTSSQPLTSCNFCDAKNCSQCLRPCDACQTIFCHLCSVINYDYCVERVFCLQCSG